VLLNILNMDLKLQMDLGSVTTARQDIQTRQQASECLHNWVTIFNIETPV
jgi:hypothetical protein